MSKNVTKLVAGLIGVGYAVIYGLWTAIVTGGGHVNLVWLGLFIFVEFFGIYFPLMSILATDLRSFFAKVIFGTLIFFNLVASSIMILGWIFESGGSSVSDFDWTVRAQGIESIVLCAVLHFLPTIAFTAWLIISMRSTAALPDVKQLGLSNN